MTEDCARRAEEELISTEDRSASKLFLEEYNSRMSLSSHQTVILQEMLILELSLRSLAPLFPLVGTLGHILVTVS